MAKTSWFLVTFLTLSYSGCFRNWKLGPWILNESSTLKMLQEVYHQKREGFQMLSWNLFPVGSEAIIIFQKKVDNITRIIDFRKKIRCPCLQVYSLRKTNICLVMHLNNWPQTGKYFSKTCLLGHWFRSLVLNQL